MIKNLIMSVGYFFGTVLVSTIILTILNYFNILGDGFISGLKFAIPEISICIISYLLGKKALKRGYLEGGKLGGIIILIFLIISAIVKNFKFRSLIYYLILLLSASLSSMFGINRKKESN
jgi:putative membrane protein (TIGR04086 family)